MPSEHDVYAAGATMSKNWHIMAPLARSVLLVAFVVPHLCFLFGCEKESAEPEAQSIATTTQNAAEEYRSLHAAMGVGLIAQLERAGGELTPELERSLPTAQPVIDRLVWATRLDRCDWSIDYSAGSDTELPHLPKLRELARLLRAHAQQAARSGDLETAAQDVAAIVRLSRHVGGESAIEAMVAFAMLRVGTDLAVEHAGTWSKKQRDMVLVELRRIDPHDPFGGNAMLEGSRQLAAREGMVIDEEERWFTTGQREAVNGLAAAISALE